MDHEAALLIVRRDASVLQQVEQTEELCLEAVKINGLALRYVKNQTEEICLEAVNEASIALEYVTNQTEEICLEAIMRSFRVLNHVKNKTERICLAAIDLDPYTITMMLDVDEIILQKILEYEPGVLGIALKCVNQIDVTFEQYVQLCLIAVRMNGLLLRYVPKLIPNRLRDVIDLKIFCDAHQEICLEAVKQNGFAISYVEDQTEELCIIAIKNPTFHYQDRHFGLSDPCRLFRIKDREMRERCKEHMIDPRFLMTKKAR